MINRVLLGSFVFLGLYAMQGWSDTVPGVVVHHSPASSGSYVGSPGIVILPDGDYLAKGQEFGPKTTENQSGKTLLFRSSDKSE